MHADYITEIVFLYIFMVLSILLLQYLIELIYYIARRIKRPDETPRSTKPYA